MPRHIRKPWLEADDEKVRTLAPEEAAKATGRTIAAVHQRRYLLGVSKPTPMRPWTKRDRDIAKSMAPALAAKKIRRSVDSIKTCRHNMGVATLVAKWTPKEDRIL
jgi:hypothetical protein